MKTIILLTGIAIVGYLQLDLQAFSQEYENPYHEINAYLEKMGLSLDNSESASLTATKEEILEGLKPIYEKWGLQFEYSKPYPSTMLVCPLEKKGNCKTWYW